MIGRSVGIYPLGTGKTVKKNVVSLNGNGILGATAGTLAGNVAVADGIGIGLGIMANGIGNAVYGSRFAGMTVNATPFSGAVSKNNLFGNGSLASSSSPNCGLYVPGPSPGSVAALNDYWGALTGPGPDPADEACSAGTTTTAPAASRPFEVKAPIKP